MTVRERMEQEEYDVLAPHAQKAAESQGRLYPEEDNDVRTCYQRDADRILHSKSFRRLMHKTQVFLSPEGDHYRTRMTHTLEVSRIARTAAGMQTAGTHSATSHQRPLGMMVLNSVMNSFVSDGVLFIFQLPAITVLRYFRFMVSISYISQSL